MASLSIMTLVIIRICAMLTQCECIILHKHQHYQPVIGLHLVLLAPNQLTACLTTQVSHIMMSAPAHVGVGDPFPTQ